MAMRELLPMRALLQEMTGKLGLDYAKQSLVRSTVFEDNQGCLSMVQHSQDVFAEQVFVSQVPLLPVPHWQGKGHRGKMD